MQAPRMSDVSSLLSHVSGKDDRNYTKLIKKLKKKKLLFIDDTPFFDSEDKILTKFKEHQQLYLRSPDVQWKRPNEFCQNPKLFVGSGEKRKVVSPGNLLFASAAQCLLLNDELWHTVVPEHHVQSQQWYEEKKDSYHGIIHFCFWKFNKWVEVVIDDRLPMMNGEHLLTHFSSHKDELWLPLLEKALVKLYGSFEKMDEASTEEFLEDLTGGICQYSYISPFQGELSNAAVKQWYSTIHEELNYQSIIACGAFDTFYKESLGLWHDQLYAIRVVKEMQIKSVKSNKKLVCVRNLWGKDTWKGWLSKTSDVWKSLTEKEKKSLEAGRHAEEFWMTIDDFCTEFNRVYICRIKSRASQRHEEMGVGQWTVKRCPQFVFHIDNQQNHDKEEPIIMYLERAHEGDDYWTEKGIGIKLYRVELNRDIRVSDLSVQSLLIQSNELSYTRSTLLHTKLRTGRYVILPTTEGNTDLICGVIVRILTFSCYFFSELISDQIKKNMCSCLGIKVAFQPKLVTRVIVISAKGLLRARKEAKNAKYYCLITCEGREVRSRSITFSSTQKDVLLWEDDAAIFYRSKPSHQHIHLEVFSNAPNKMGYYIHKTTEDTELTEHELSLEDEVGTIKVKFLDVHKSKDGTLMT